MPRKAIYLPFQHHLLQSQGLPPVAQESNAKSPTPETAQQEANFDKGSSAQAERRHGSPEAGVAHDQPGPAPAGALPVPQVQVCTQDLTLPNQEASYYCHHHDESPSSCIRQFHAATFPRRPAHLCRKFLSHPGCDHLWFEWLPCCVFLEPAG